MSNCVFWVYSLLLAAGLGIGLTLQAQAQTADPFADNPFPVPYKQAPADPALRWAGFQSRVGTYLPTDPYHFWRFDVTNRAEMQDAYWREEMVVATVPLGWNGSFTTLEPGKTTQAWRNAVLREVNLHRYIYGNGSNFLVEDPSHNPELQAAAFVGAWREDITHTLTPAMMPPGFAYTDLAIAGAHNSLGLGPMMAGDSTWLFLSEGPGNPGAGHRAVFLMPEYDTVGTGDTPRKTGADPSYSYSTALRIKQQPFNPWPQPLPVGDPFAQYLAWPRKNSFTTPELMGYTSALISLDVYAGGLTFDASDVRVSVTINGQPLVDDGNFHRAPYNITAVGAGGGRQWLVFAIDHILTANYSYVPGINGPVLTNDYVFEVTVENLRMSRTFSFLTPAQLAQIDPRAFENHTLKWSFTVYDPLIVKPASYNTSSTIAALSTRATVGSGDNVLIAGVIVSGADPLKVAFRAQGPSLAAHGIQQPATNPRLEIYQMGATAPFGGNDDWKSGVNWRLVQSYALAPSSDLESVAVATLAPGLYTAVVSDAGAGGVGIVEAYAIDSQSSSQLTAVSTRGIVGGGESVMIAGIITQRQQTLVVRTKGPALAALGVAGTVYGTRLKIYNQSTGQMIYQNAGWDAPGNERFHTDLASWVAGLDPAREAALVLTLPAGAYTAIVESTNGTPGVGIVEIYQVKNVIYTPDIIPTKTYGDAPFQLAGVTSTSGRPVTFSIDSGPATISGNTVTITGAGTVTVRASPAAGDTWAAPEADRTFAVVKATPSGTFPERTVQSGHVILPGDLNAQFAPVGMGRNPTGTITYWAVVTREGGTAGLEAGYPAFLNYPLGDYTVRAYLATDDNYNSTYVETVWHVVN